MKKKIRYLLNRAIPGIGILLVSTALTANASIIITNPAGMTTKTFNSSGSDGAGDSVSIVSSGSFFNSSIDGEVVSLDGPGSASVTFTFASPLASFGFDTGYFDNFSLTAVSLSNGDALTTALPHAISTNSFYGISSSSNFNTATLTFTVSDSADIKDFRLGAAAGTPEPATLALVAPLLLAGLAGLRLRKRAVR